MGRTRKEINAEIAKVEKARLTAIKKQIRCDKRLMELSRELPEVMADCMQEEEEEW
ncbi:MAG: hypothetical protein Q4C48_08840 [Lachnospiraceae bacterium]|nr:hypothetical protein [Lachnospiraceae bacterium]